jgi:hypothetical protein
LLLVFFFSDRVSYFCLGLALDCDLISTSRVAGIIVMNHT